MRRSFAVLVLLGLAVAAVVTALDCDAAPVLGYLHWGAVAMLVVVLGALGGSALLWRDPLRARLDLDDGGLVLTFCLGLRRHRVSLPAPLVAGRLERVPLGGGDPERYSTPTSPEPAGTYLSVGSGRHQLVIGSPTATGLRQHWSGWAQGPVRRRWDVTLAPGDAVSLQYALHERGLLAVRR